MPNPISVTVYDPSPSDPRILAALTARKLLGEVVRAVDIAGRIADGFRYFSQCADQQGRRPEEHYRTPQSKPDQYESAAEEVIDFVGVRGDMVVIMGEEILRPNLFSR